MLELEPGWIPVCTNIVNDDGLREEGGKRDGDAEQLATAFEYASVYVDWICGCHSWRCVRKTRGLRMEKEQM